MAADHPFTELRTPRLVLRRFRPADASAFRDYRQDPEVARYQSWDPTYSLEEAERFMASIARTSPGTPGEWFQFAVVSATTGHLLGDVGIRTDAENPDLVELGITLSGAEQGKGYATEMAAAVIAYAFDVLNAAKIRATTDSRNDASIKLLERLGFLWTSTEDVTFKGASCREHTYELIAP
jgi:RimJ/RimL family protein N-acetyltransferase